jgi:hypothetical protein
MESAAPPVTRQDLQTRLIEKAWKDPEFRKNIVQDPKGMLERQLGRPLPANMNIYVHEEDPNTLHFAIPPSPSNVSELSDDDLARVAGGTDIIITTCMMALADITIVAGTAAVAGAATAAATAGAALGGSGVW